MYAKSAACPDNDSVVDEKGRRKLSSGSLDDQHQDLRTLWVGNIDSRMTDAELETLFRGRALVTRVKICRHEDSDAPGFGFVELASRTAACNLLEELHDGHIQDEDGHRFRVNWAAFQRKSITKDADAGCDDRFCTTFRPKKMCQFFPNCTKGRSCTFAHSAKELHTDSRNFEGRSPGNRSSLHQRTSTMSTTGSEPDRQSNSTATSQSRSPRRRPETAKQTQSKKLITTSRFAVFSSSDSDSEAAREEEELTARKQKAPWRNKKVGSETASTGDFAENFPLSSYLDARVVDAVAEQLRLAFKVAACASEDEDGTLAVHFEASSEEADLEGARAALRAALDGSPRWGTQIFNIAHDWPEYEEQLFDLLSDESVLFDAKPLENWGDIDADSIAPLQSLRRTWDCFFSQFRVVEFGPASWPRRDLREVRMTPIRR
jgi:RNA recognition motif-containing protein